MEIISNRKELSPKTGNTQIQKYQTTQWDLSKTSNLTRSETRVFKHIQEPSIAVLSETDEDFELKIAKALLEIMTDLGIKTSPDEYSQNRIVYILQTYYREMSIGELKLAFELAFMDILSVDIEHYNSFDIKYLTRILNAYRAYRSEKRKAIDEKLEQDKPEPTPEELAQRHRNFLNRIVEAYEKYKNDDVFEVRITWLVYDFLLENDLLEISENQWNVFIEEAEKIHKRKLITEKSCSNRTQRMQRIKNFDILRFQYPNELSKIRSIAKELALKAYFKMLKEKELNLKEIFIKSGVYEQRK